MKSKILLTALFSSLPFIDNFASTSLSSEEAETHDSNSNNMIKAPHAENFVENDEEITATQDSAENLLREG